VRFTAEHRRRENRAAYYGLVWTQLLTAKSKIGPLKSRTISLLKLNGALLLTAQISAG
jgi:hypothetical protein